MRKMVLAAAITALPFLVNAAEDEFYGTYTLISTSRTRLDTGQVETFARERGFITYGKDGRIRRDVQVRRQNNGASHRHFLE